MTKHDSTPDPMATSLGAVAPDFAGSNTAPLLPYHDLRQWLEEARKLDEVKEVGGLSPYFVFDDVPGTLTVHDTRIFHRTHQARIERKLPRQSREALQNFGYLMDS